MNYILSIVFLTVMFSQYILIGESVLSFANYEKTLGKRILMGFFLTFCVFGILSFLCVIAKVGWTVFFIICSVIFGVLDIGLCVLNFKKFSEYIKNFKFKFLWNGIVDNWFLFVFVIVFTIFAISNQLPFYHMNYDDAYYIGKVVNTIQTPMLLNENYFNGAILKNRIEFFRMISSYELSYAYLASLFHIYVPFFCRITMAFHNYVLTAIAYKLFASCFIQNKYTQFAILPFFVFLIPFGYLYSGELRFLSIRSYDLWQFQTAAFYGSSVVRNMAIPTIYVFSYPLFEKMDIKKLMCIGSIFIALAYFSTIAIIYLVMLLVVLFILKFVYMIYSSFKKKSLRMGLLGCLGLVCMIGILVLSKSLDTIIPNAYYQNSLSQIRQYYSVWYAADFILRFGFVPLIILLICHFKKGIWPILFIILLYGMNRVLAFPEIQLYSSAHYMFVVLRYIASMQYMVFFAYGLVCIEIMNKLDKYVMSFIFSHACVAIVIVFFVIFNQRFLNCVFLGSGISEDGWDFNRVLDVNTQMVPDMVLELGDYFNALEYGNYRVYTPANIPCDETSSPQTILMMSSNRVVIPSQRGFRGLNKDQNKALELFCKRGKGDYERIQKLIKRYHIDFMMVFNDNAVSILTEDGHELVLSNDNYNLIKINR